MDRGNGVKVNINNTRRVATEPQMPRVVAPAQHPVRMATDPAQPQPQAAGKKHRRPLTRLRKIGIAVLVVGVLALAGGGGFLAYRLLSPQEEVSDDATFITEIGTWQRDGEPSVVWDFTASATSSDPGKGSLTTNDHVNDYDFTWALDGDQLAISTDWLYELDDTFTYALDQQAQKLTLTADDETWTFVPAASK